MRKLALLIGLTLCAGIARADSATPRLGLLIMSTGTTNWGTKLNNSVFAVADSSAAAQFKSNTFTATNTFTSAMLLSGSSLTATGSAGTITTQSSVTASAFFGDGSHLTGIPSTGAISGSFVQKTGDTMTGGLEMSNSSITLTGPTGYISGQSSITASAFFGNGSGLTGVTATGIPNTVTSSFTVLGNLLVNTANSRITLDTPTPTQVPRLYYNEAGTLAFAVQLLGGGGGGGNRRLDISPQISGSSGGIQVFSSGTVQIGGSGVDSNNLLDVFGSMTVGAAGSQSTIAANGSMYLNSGSSLTLSGANGYITGQSSITASAFFGNGSALTGISRSSATVIPQTSFTNTAFSVCLATVTLTSRGFPIIVGLVAMADNTNNDKQVYSTILVDGAYPSELSGGKAIGSATIGSGRYSNVGNGITLNSVSAGTHSYCVAFRTSANTATVYNDASFASQLSARETPQ
jgi:hypothetical protein